MYDTRKVYYVTQQSKNNFTLIIMTVNIIKAGEIMKQARKFVINVSSADFHKEINKHFMCNSQYSILYRSIWKYEIIRIKNVIFSSYTNKEVSV